MLGSRRNSDPHWYLVELGIKPEGWGENNLLHVVLFLDYLIRKVSEFIIRCSLLK